MGKSPWICTLATQLSLCCALFLLFGMSNFRDRSVFKKTGGRHADFYFISVRGGFRPLNLQTHLLKQMEKVVKAYKAKFVVNVSELGVDDPLARNATWSFPSLRVPWYNTGASKGYEMPYFLKKFELSHGNILDIIGVDTGLLQDLIVESSGSSSSQLHWLTRTLQATNSNWCIVVGFHSLFACKADKKLREENQVYKNLHDVFLKFGVNAYLGSPSCTKSSYARHGGIAYIGNPGATEKEPYSRSDWEISDFSRDLSHGFLLHRVDSLEIVTYFVSLAGEVVHRIRLQQRGKDVM